MHFKYKASLADMKPVRCYTGVIITVCVVSLMLYTTSITFYNTYSYETCNEGNHLVPSSSVLSFREGKTHLEDHQHLMNYIRQHIRGPSEKPLQLGNPERKYFSQVNQDRFVDELLGGMKEGFFVECGAADGERFSNTLFFERERNWTGLLIEANPVLDNSLLHKHRKAYSIHACLSVSKVPKVMKFRPVGLLGGLDGTMDSTHLKAVQGSLAFKREIDVQCFPLVDILEALGRKHVHFLSLDVEGPELEILKTIDWNKIRIDVMSIEYRLFDGRKNNKTGSFLKLQKLREFILGTGLYKEAAILPEGLPEDKPGLDVVYKRLD